MAQQILCVPYCFKKYSLLHKYMLDNKPHLVSKERKSYYIEEIVNTLKEWFLKKKMFCQQNPMIILCDTPLDQALDRYSFHVMQLVPLILKHLAPFTNGARLTIVPQSLWTLPSMPPLTTMAQAELRHQANQNFDTEASYLVPEPLLEVLRSLKGVDQEQLVFPYKMISKLVSDYIVFHKSEFFDLRNPVIAHIEGSLLEKAFKVPIFARSQVIPLLRMGLVLKVEKIK